MAENDDGYVSALGQGTGRQSGSLHGDGLYCLHMCIHLNLCT